MLERELLSTLLNFANGALDWDGLVHDADADGVDDTALEQVFRDAEDLVLDPPSRCADYQEQANFLRQVQNPYGPFAP